MNCHCCGDEYTSLKTDVYICPECGHIYRDYTGDSIEYHTNCYRDEEGFRGSGEILNGKITEQFHENRKEMCTNRVAYSNSFVKKGDSVLDIGAGAGTFARLLRESLSLETIECAELDDRLVAECRNLGFETTQSGILELENDKKFDVVCMWHVLEHIQDVKESIQKISKIATKFAIIEVPLLVALDGKGRRRDLTPPNDGNYDGHYHYFCERSFKKLIDDSGMRVVDLREGVQSPALLAVIEND